MAAADLSALSDDELEATRLALSECQQQLTDQISRVRVEQQHRAWQADQPSAGGDFGEAALADAITAAPARAKQIAADREAKAAEVERLAQLLQLSDPTMAAVVEQTRQQVRDRLNDQPWPWPDGFAADVLRPVLTADAFAGAFPPEAPPQDG